MVAGVNEMDIWSYYRKCVENWVDPARKIKAGAMVFLCIICEVVFIVLAKAAQKGIGLINLWLLPIGFPSALAVHMLLSLKGFDTKNKPDHAWKKINIGSYLGIIFGLVLGYLEISEGYYFAGLACYAFAVISVVFLLLWTVLYYKQFGVDIAFLQIVRAIFAPLVAIPYFFLMLMGTDTRPNTKETHRQIRLELERDIRESREIERMSKKSEPGFVDFMDDLVHGGSRTEDLTVYDGEVYRVREGYDGTRFIETDDGKKYQSRFDGEYRDE